MRAAIKHNRLTSGALLSTTGKRWASVVASWGLGMHQVGVSGVRGDQLMGLGLWESWTRMGVQITGLEEG